MPEVAATVAGVPDEDGVYRFAINGERRTADDAARILADWHPVTNEDGVTVAFQVFWPE